MNDLIERLRALSRSGHGDFSIVDEAAEVIAGFVEDMEYIRDQCEDHPLFMGADATIEEIDRKGGDAATITDLAQRAAAALLPFSRAGKDAVSSEETQEGRKVGEG